MIVIVGHSIGQQPSETPSRSRIRSKSSKASTSSSISTKAVEHIIEKLKSNNNRLSTKKTYYNIWKKFNQFFIRLDRKPKTWEDRLTLFVGYLVQDKNKSSTIKSYISAVRSVLMEDGVKLNEDKYLLTSLTRACKLKNDHVQTRFPIRKGVLKILLKTTKTYFRDKGQPYLAKLFRALFVSAYYGLLRVGELTAGPHAILAKNVHIASNKNKILFILESSKTHGKDKHPQLVKISSTKIEETFRDRSLNLKNLNLAHSTDNICVYTILNEFLSVRHKGQDRNKEQFFVYSDNSPVTPSQMRKNSQTASSYFRVSTFSVQYTFFQNWKML